MDCKKFQEHVTPAVDKRLTKEESARFDEHAEKCPECRNEYELESITKSLIRSRVKMQRTPAGVLERISDGLRDEQSRQNTSLAQRIRVIMNSSYTRPAIAFAVGCLAVIILLRSPNTTTETQRPVVQASFIPGDVIEQSLANYAKVRSGEIIPQETSDKPEVLAGFFGGKTDFPVIVPRMKKCSLLGGVLNEFAGMKLAHVVYKHESEIVYMYQTCWEEVQKGEKLGLPAQAMQELKKTGWYSATRPDGCSIVLWTKNRTLCSAVAHMTKEALIACLADGDASNTYPW